MDAVRGDKMSEASKGHRLTLRRLGIDTQQETFIYMRPDCHICRSEGFTAHARIQVAANGRSVVATLGLVATDLLAPGEASLSENACRRLAVEDGDAVAISHAPPLESLSFLRSKVYGHKLDGSSWSRIIEDVARGQYSDIHLSSFVTACASQILDFDEMKGLTRAMVDVGERLDWGRRPIADKHCVGGLPGNRTTPIVVAIAASCGLVIPKTSSRAITSPAGTADTMETMAPVDLDVASMRRVVEREGGCVVWGGAVDLSPADDVLVRVERSLDLDSEGQLVASVLSKKIAAGATHLVLDLPVGPTAKVRTDQDALRLSRLLTDVAAAFGIRARTIRSDGRQPVGRGIGPALEARDVLAVLQNEPRAPQDLRCRAVDLAGSLLELLGAAESGKGTAMADRTISEGRAWHKFQAICEAQGGQRTPPSSSHTHPVLAPQSGRIVGFDNRVLARIAKLAGAPVAKAAGLELHAALDDVVCKDQPLYTIHAEAKGELEYALDYMKMHSNAVQLDSVP